jgi:valyl-tRNA synthetase
VILPLEGLIDRKAEAERHRKALADLGKQIGSLEAKLANTGFVVRAPAEVVRLQRTKLRELVMQRDAIEKLLAEAS